MQESFEEYVAARSPRLYATAVLLTQDRGQAEDLVQTSLLKAWRHWSRIDSPDAYLRRTLVHTYTSWWRRRWNGELPTADPPERYVASGSEAAEVRTDLRTALARLPRRQRAVVVLRFYEDLSVAEVARELGCSEGTVKSQTSKALARLGADDALAGHRVQRARPREEGTP
ncbi:MAG: SigE family RNA polymerase sigma factor [Nocardioides sp.]